MHDYYLRCIESDVPALLQLGVQLGALEAYVIETDPPDTKYRASEGGALDVIGPIFSPAVATGAVDDQGFPVFILGEPKKDANGNVYWHANLRTPLDLRAVAEEMAVVHPEIAAGLADIGKFFVTDSQGIAVAPVQPARVFL